MDLYTAIATATDACDDAQRQTGGSRELSLARTKLDEAHMWAGRAAAKALETHPPDFVGAVFGGPEG